MNRSQLPIIGIVIAAAVHPVSAQAPAAQAAEAKPHLFAPAELTWGPGPGSLPAGVQAAVLEGNPMEAGPFTARFKLPANFRIPPHWHPAVEHVTVVTGSLYIGQGEKVDTAAMKELTPGGFMLMPPHTPHYVRTRGETVIQIHGIGPWGITYVNPADDPRPKSN